METWGQIGNEFSFRETWNPRALNFTNLDDGTSVNLGGITLSKDGTRIAFPSPCWTRVFDFNMDELKWEQVGGPIATCSGYNTEPDDPIRAMASLSGNGKKLIVRPQ